MKKISKLAMMFLLLLPGCNNVQEDYNMENQINNVAFYAGSIRDDSGENNKKLYKIKAYVTDEYYLDCSAASTLNLYDKKGKIIKANAFDSIVSLKKGEIYFIEVEGKNANTKFEITLFPQNNQLVTPYEMNSITDLADYSTKSTKENPNKAAIVDYTKREGGTYIYSNMPESMPSEVLNTIIMRQNDLTGECFLTLEHQNKTGQELYMGYRLTNQENHDVYVTVMNVGYQTNGSWLGDRSWMDYYGVKYEIDFSIFRKDTFNYNNQAYTAMKWFKDYLNFDVDYIPNPIKPITYKIPAGKHIYIIGGTTADSYDNINVHNTANILVSYGECVNGNVRFNVHNGKVTGDLCVYNNINAINKEDTVIQNVRRYGDWDDFGGRLGFSPIHGVVENNPVWIFNDLTDSGFLPVTYQSYYADELKETYEPNEAVTGCYNHTVLDDRWYTHLSAQLNHQYCGSDMVDLYAYQGDKLITFSNYVANPAGNIWDFGNWMIEYQENHTFVNRGNNDRTIDIFLRNGGSVFYIIKNMDNEIIKAGMTLDVCTERTPILKYVVPAHSKQTISVQYVLPANTSGSVSHGIELI